ncbi:MAG: DUF4157 domain-containing protein [Roseiflexaceae bacterium]
MTVERQTAQLTQVKPAPAASGMLQRTCACGQHTVAGGECEACKQKRTGTLQRASISAPPVGRVPPIVHDVLRSPGQPLDAATRAFLEPRFGHDFSGVRVHTDARAAESVQTVNALAYTVGQNIVFGVGQYAPGTSAGRRLMAHELTHVVQQHGSAPVHLDKLSVEQATSSAESEAEIFAEIVSHGWRAPNSTMSSSGMQRACLSAAECAAPKATLTEFVKETQKKPENISKADNRKKACTKVPPDATCTSDGHGATATALTALLNKHYKSRLSFITGIFVNKDMPATWAAVTHDCANFMPPLPGGKCTFVPDALEAQAKLYQAGNKSVAGKPREQWLTDALGTLTHETEHARFNSAAPIAKPNATACKFEDHKSNLSELAAHLSEMHVYYREALARPDKDRFKRFYTHFNFWVKNGSEDISGIVKELRCKCECADANYYITKTAESVSTSQKWDSNELIMIHTELRDPKWTLNWPVSPPASVNAVDLPTVAAAPFKLE